MLEFHFCCLCPSLLRLLQDIHFYFLVKDPALRFVHAVNTQHLRNLLLLRRGIFALFVLVWSHYFVCYYLVTVKYRLLWRCSPKELYSLFDTSIARLNPLIVNRCPFIVKLFQECKALLHFYIGL